VKHFFGASGEKWSEGNLKKERQRGSGEIVEKNRRIVKNLHTTRKEPTKPLKATETRQQPIPIEGLSQGKMVLGVAAWRGSDEKKNVRKKHLYREV